jgi:hypothetical protein
MNHSATCGDTLYLGVYMDYMAGESPEIRPYTMP